MTNTKKDIQEIHEAILRFRDERDWAQFHKPKDLLLALSIEISELQELFLWKNDKEVKSVPRESVAEEVADIFIYLSYICGEFDIDLGDAVSKKLEMNARKYPVEKAFGSSKKYTEFEEGGE